MKRPSANSDSLQQITCDLAIVSFTILFQELLLIRWLGQQIRVLAYFPNIILISAFLGIGTGCLRGRKQEHFITWPILLAILITVTGFMSRIVFTQRSTSEHLWLLYSDLGPQARVINSIYAPLLIIFILSAASFIPLGHVLANRLAACQRLRSPLWGYLWDILGSSVGAAAFVLLSFLHTRPVIWFFPLIMGGLWLSHKKQDRWLMFLLGVGMLCGAKFLDRADFYTPYYAISLKTNQDHSLLQVLANGSAHQYMLPLKNSDPVSNDNFHDTPLGYHLPYRSLAAKPKKVLVLGAGTGNDVAVALDEGVESVDAVEIDPGILDLGRHAHPDRPYQSPQVHCYNTDARSYLNTTSQTYDLIVFGTLDSMTRLSALSNVRLDNFVYTLECFQAARRHLTPTGGVVLYFMVGNEFIFNKLITMMAIAFQEVPIIKQQYFQVFNTILMAGPAFQSHHGTERAQVMPLFLEKMSKTDISSDDWPFLYLEKRTISRFYCQTGASLLFVAILFVSIASDGLKRRKFSPDWVMLLFGMAFLLLETRAVTAMNLLWGATWLTNAVVIECVFCTIFLGTLITAWRPLSYAQCMTGLILALTGIYVCRFDHYFGVNPLVKFGLSVLAVGGPILFASLAFAGLFAERVDPMEAFGWNLLGAVLGGLLEFLSMIIGLKSLILLAMILYLSAALVQGRHRV